jgi:hypothetical protein
LGLKDPGLVASGSRTGFQGYQSGLRGRRAGENPIQALLPRRAQDALRTMLGYALLVRA